MSRAMADLDFAENFCPGPDQHAMANFRMAIAGLFSCAAKGDPLQDRNIVVNHRRLADDEAGGVIEEYPLADPRRGIDVDCEYRRRAALQIERKVAPPRLQQGMREPVRLQGMKSLEIE